MMPRDKHLEWAKQRALEYLDAGDTKNAFTSMLSDMGKHPELSNHVGNKIGMGYMFLPGFFENPEMVRRWIVGYN